MGKTWTKRGELRGFVDSSLVVIARCYGNLISRLPNSGGFLGGSKEEICYPATALQSGRLSSQEDAPSLGRFVEHCFDWI